MPQPDIDSILVTLAPTVSVVYALAGVVSLRDDSPTALRDAAANLDRAIKTLEAA